MKRRCKVCLLALFILLFAFSVGAQEHLVISKPASASKRQGVIAERILEEAYSKIGVEIEYIVLPIERSLIMSNNGDTDGEFLRTYDIGKKCPNLIMISVPIYRMDVMAYTKRVEFEVNGWQSLSPYTIGIVRGMKILQNKTKGMKIEMVNTVDQAFSKLDAGRTDVVVEFRNAQCRLNELSLSGIKILEPPIDKIFLFHFIHKRHKDLVVKLEKVLWTMKNDGKIQALQKEGSQNLHDLCQ